MTDDHKTHDQVDHGDHTHGPGCGHTAIQHEGHTDYLHDGHMHHQHEGHHDEHAVGVTSQNPDSCTPDHSCSDHAAGHQHGSDCGHEAVPHGEHTDYLVGSHLHHPHGEHCDDHGKI